MSKDKVLLVAGDAALGERVSQMLRERGIPTDLVDPAADDTGPDALFDRAFDRQATAVLVVEPLPRYAGSPVAPSDDLLAAALRAARSPLVRGVGWITSRTEASPWAEFRQRGKPFGVLRPNPILQIMVDPTLPKEPGQTAVVASNLAERVSQDGPLPLDDAARAVADWFEREGHREGSETVVRGPDQPLETAIRGAGFTPLRLAPWRAGLNRALGMAVLDEPSFTIRKKSFFRSTPRGVTQPSPDAG
jgi:hypothetical protein